MNYAFQSKKCRTCIHRCGITGSFTTNPEKNSSLFCAYSIDTGKCRSLHVKGAGDDCEAYVKGKPCKRGHSSVLVRYPKNDDELAMTKYLSDKMYKGVQR